MFKDPLCSEGNELVDLGWALHGIGYRPGSWSSELRLCKALTLTYTLLRVIITVSAKGGSDLPEPVPRSLGLRRQKSLVHECIWLSASPTCCNTPAGKHACLFVIFLLAAAAVSFQPSQSDPRSALSGPASPAGCAT